MSEPREARCIRALLAVHAGIERRHAAEIFGFVDGSDLHQAECDLRWKSASRSHFGIGSWRAEERS